MDELSDIYEDIRQERMGIDVVDAQTSLDRVWKTNRKVLKNIIREGNEKKIERLVGVLVEELDSAVDSLLDLRGSLKKAQLDLGA